MDKKYLIPVILMVGLGLVLALLPDKKSYDEMLPEELLRQVTNPSRFISADDVADRIIRKDPSMILVDVRNNSDYAAYSLPGAMNIPLSDLLKPEQFDLLSQEGIEFIFFSNSDIIADQAWILGKRKGLSNIFVLKGGLNEWFSTFFLMQPLPETASATEIEIYQFRNGVRQYFTGGEIITPGNIQAEKITVAPRTKKTAAEGGC
jgi:sulfur-carrier protein adenylyltransferase/sulfurtransferase